MKLLLKNCYLNLIVLLTLTFILIYFTNRYILTVGFYENSSDPLSGIPGESQRIYESLQSWIYISSAIYLIAKLFIISVILSIALYLNDQQIKFNRIFKVTILAEFIFLIPACIKIVSFRTVFPDGTVSDWHQYYILSALSLFKGVPADWAYALQTLNVFEVGYWFLLAFGISRISGLDYDLSLRTVVVSYLPALIIWVAVVTFCTLILFPGFG
ncbi:hypothetical protein AB6735_22300 [Mucilaginibacter sp. RCC_168]